MNIIIRNTSIQPIYEQIYDQIKNQILTGELVEDHALPSIRALASDLRISVITTKRAYDDLERDGFIVTVPGKGSYVAERNLELMRENLLNEIETLLVKVLEKAQIGGIDQAELIEMLNLLSMEK